MVSSTKSYPLSTSLDLDPLLERIGDARVVLLGEASHGTHEFYTWRTAISKRLLEEKKFSFIAVEGDWPDCYRVNRYIKDLESRNDPPEKVLTNFNRWPTWMWANWEVAALVSWLRDFNRRSKQKAGFYGLDMYSLWESMESILAYLKKEDPRAADIAEQAINCFSSYAPDETSYAAHALSKPCREQVVNLLKEIRMKAPAYDHDPEAELNITQNAYVAVEAEKYYRNMMSFDDQTWNIRDSHMMSTLERLMEFHGKDGKAIVWEHNTHIGDARYTDMARTGLHNIGQLCRHRYPGEETFIVGFGSYEGTVTAGSGWGAPLQQMDLPEAAEGSIEYVLHQDSDHDRLFLFESRMDDEIFSRSIPHRAVGVVYNPYMEKRNYVPSLIGKRYDAFIYVDKSTGLHPLNNPVDRHQVPETFPFEF